MGEKRVYIHLSNCFFSTYQTVRQVKLNSLVKGWGKVVRSPGSKSWLQSMLEKEKKKGKKNCKVQFFVWNHSKYSGYWLAMDGVPIITWVKSKDELSARPMICGEWWKHIEYIHTRRETLLRNSCENILLKRRIQIVMRLNKKLGVLEDQYLMPQFCLSPMLLDTSKAKYSPRSTWTKYR